MPTQRTKRAATQYGQKDSPEMREKFLNFLRSGELPGMAAKKLGLGRRTVFNWKDRDKEFAEAWLHAVEDGLDKLEAEARRRAEVGCLKPVFQGGVQVGEIREYSDTLMSLLLKGRRRDVFNVERHEHTGADGQPIDIIQRRIVRAPGRGKDDK